MLRLVGGTHFLVLSRVPGFEHHTLAVRKRFDEALRDWKAGDRVSPIYPINNAEVPSFVPGMKSWALFFGPHDPSALPLDLPGQVFVSLGLYNLLVISTNEADRTAALNVASRCDVAWEEWAVEGDRIQGVSYFTEKLPRKLPTEVTEGIHGQERELTPALRELRVLLATCVGHAEHVDSTLCAELGAINRRVRSALAYGTDSVIKLGLIVGVNASLSRFSSQLFSGTSPIAQTESHFWPHSLLGVGTAVLALNRLRRFLETTLVNARFLSRLEATDRVPRDSKALHSTGSTYSFWESAPLFSDAVERLLDQEPGEHLPLITYFSGRDGYRSSHFSLSVPLETVSSCNATPWTLHTLTHEISHTVINAILAKLVPDPQSEAALTEAIALLEPDRPRSLFEQFRAYFCYALVIHGQTGPWNGVVTPRYLRTQIHTFASQVNEILTHVFDYLYFYGKNDERYIRSVWASWAVIPNIHHRIRDYLLRCLCALSSTTLRHRVDGPEIALDRLGRTLEQVRGQFPRAQYLGEALELLGEEPERRLLLARLRASLLWVRFVRYVVYSEEVARELERDRVSDSGESSALDMRSLEFGVDRVANPLTFTDAFAVDDEGNELRSTWILQKLAFAGDG